MKKFIPLCLILTLVLNSCTLFKKDIRKPVTIYYNENEFIASISSNAYFTKYVDFIDPSEVTAKFTEHFKNEGTNTKNITLISDKSNADFILKFRSLELSEASKVERITDANSQFNGQDIVLNSVECYASFEIQDAKHPARKFLICSNSKSRSEKFSNNRDLADLITGANKDKSQYKTKLLNDGIAIQLSEDVGRRIWVPITRQIAKTQR